MSTLEKGQDKVKKICDRLRHEVLEPAKQEAEEIIAAAHKKAEQIVAESHKRAEELVKQARQQNEQEQAVFQASLKQAAKQATEALKQEIEHKLFNDELQELLKHSLDQPQIVARLINSIVQAIDREGLGADLRVAIPREVSASEVSALLAEGIQQKLKEHPLEMGSFKGGLQVHLAGKKGAKLTIDLTDETIKQLLANYVRKDFRQLIFNS